VLFSIVVLNNRKFFGQAVFRTNFGWTLNYSLEIGWTSEQHFLKVTPLIGRQTPSAGNILPLLPAQACIIHILKISDSKTGVTQLVSFALYTGAKAVSRLNKISIADKSHTIRVHFSKPERK